MSRAVFSLLLATCFYTSNGQPSPRFIVRIGVEGQFYIKKEMNQQANAPMGFLKMHGSDGTLASVGMGVGTSFLFNYNRNMSFSIAPMFRLASLETSNPQGAYGPERVGIALDLHGGVQWKLHSRKWLVNNSALGVGLSLLNIGQSFDTKYSWFKAGQLGEYQASTLMTLGVQMFYEHSLSSNLSAKFIVIYTGGNFIDWSPLYAYTMHGNISISYNIFSR